MRVLIIDQCSASKSYSDDIDPFGLDELDGSPEELLEERDVNGIEARDLYTGKQQRRIGTAVRTLRQNGHEVDRYFISAGFGLVSEVERLPPYDVTFSDMNIGEIRQRGEELGITDDVLCQFKEGDSYDLAFFVLGKDYYRSLDMERLLTEIAQDTTTVLFNREEDSEKRDHVVSISARTEQARENGSTVIGLKGTYLKRFASKLDRDVDVLSGRQVVEFCTSRETSQKRFGEFE